ncbi:mannose-6-phosphate isomerase-like protein (cupin superfamily) [Alkalihalobacillus xiaoxiensis]|uniref:Mannose-6-phosphate isomerase-like protein (Cupin superfamily) n=1 Tax=Shouchella xiaoxiensis TaxID=766895 RepID=A0ABS2SNM0_9BACI|nr:cupin domain-containing protein [Shouchella xiaoxiensis]MBM7836825.1 mannose-6-phosphate isomerase-like protein (cupin superfamily) [Shouchella xiaoxiensis]
MNNEKINILQTVANVKEYKNMVLSNVNDHVVRVAVIDGEFHWHHHEADELFMVLEGELIIDLPEEKQIHLGPGEIYTVPAFTYHRTRSNGRTVNLCFEKKDTDINGA